MAIPSTASPWQPAPPTDGKPANQGAREEILIPLASSVSSVVKAFLARSVQATRLVFSPDHEHIARNGSGSRSGCDRNAQRKRPIVASTVRRQLRLPLRGAPGEGGASL